MIEEYGIRNFDTLTLGGHIKKTARDFIVEEICPNGTICTIDSSRLKKPKDTPPRGSNEFLHFTLVKKNWTTHQAISKMAEQIRVSRRRFSFAGTKDKRAITAQRVSVWNLLLKGLERVNLKDITLKNYAFQDEKIHLGELYGNRFTITIRESADPEQIQKAQEICSQGIKNYFGPQRFGTTRPTNHLIGKHLLRGNFEEAARILICLPGDRCTDVRKFADEHWGEWKEILKRWPEHLDVETSLLNYLLKHPNDYKNAFRELPKNLRRLFVHAFQSYIFNCTLSKLETLPDTLPLVGYETELQGKGGKIIKSLLEERRICQQHFKCKDMPELASKGVQRNTKIFPEKFQIVNEREQSLIIRFKLKKGSYATTVLMKLGVHVL